MTDTAAERPGEPRRWLRIVLMVVAAIQALGHAGDYAVLFDGDPTIPGTTPGGLLISATIVLAAPLALLGFIFALLGRTARAVTAIAAVSLLTWIGYLPSVVIHWPDPGLWSAQSVIVLGLLPAFSIAALVLAWSGRNLAAAAAFAVLPTIVNILAIIAFAVVVSIYGF